MRAAVSSCAPGLPGQNVWRMQRGAIALQPPLTPAVSTPANKSVFSCHSLLQSSDKASLLVGAGRCWLKVLRGELDEAEYVVPAGSGSSAGSGASVVVRRARLSQGSVTYFHDDTPLTLDGPAAERTTVSVPTRRCMLTHPASRGAPTDDRSSYTFALRLVCP